MNPIRKIGHKVITRITRQVRSRVEQQDVTIRALADANFRTRAMAMGAGKQPIRVLFVCHQPAMWNMFESVYQAMAGDREFAPLVVALPYTGYTLPKGEYKDSGMMEFCAKRKFHAIRGFDNDKDEWLNPATLVPDYVFFQQPYSSVERGIPLFPRAWCIEQVAMHARVCYIPYATLCEAGKEWMGVHPEGFFRHVSLFFMECPAQVELLAKEIEGKLWYQRGSIVLSGHPKLDYLREQSACPDVIWKRGVQNNITRILWTPRYQT
ncbi:MAG: hypothetical protein ACRD2B_02195, partial [Terriglobia bacterium]